MSSCDLGNSCRTGLDRVRLILTIPPGPTPGGDGASTVPCQLMKDWSHAKPVDSHCGAARHIDVRLHVTFRVPAQLLRSRSLGAAAAAHERLSHRTRLSK